MNFKFSVRGPDRVSEELAAVLSTKKALEFKDIFDLVYAGLLSKDFARGGEEMLRLRAHEKLQAFVTAGIVTKDQKKYKGVPKMLKEFLKTAAEFNARFAAGTHVHSGVRPKVSESTASKTTSKVARTKLPSQKVKAVKRDGSVSVSSGSSGTKRHSTLSILASQQKAKGPFHQPLKPKDTATQTEGCRQTDPDACASHSLPRVCAFVRADKVCLERVLHFREGGTGA